MARRDHGTLRVDRSGKLFIPLDSDSPARSITFTASTRVGFGGAADLQLSLISDDAPRELADESFEEFWGKTTFVDRIPLGTFSGPACLIVDADLNSTGDPLTIEAIKVESPEPKPTSVELETSPDIVLIVLDSARPDHFGCYGYKHDTSPKLDYLASESFVFTNAFATASYTTCSMPTMLTGLSFLDHGVTNRRHILPESVTTLAESLQQRGYRTSCYSANPHHGIGRGLGQGCDTFEQLWHGRPEFAAIDPRTISALATEALTENLDAPQFFMLHYIPPHEPYAPRPEFDLFGNDQYDGEVDGTVRTLRRINRGRLVPTEDDLSELIALYDGNLRMADDGVGLVLDTLRQRDRWNQTIVLVTSDHGEAFLEHGRVGHNTHVYDELLRVPFILRVPPGAVTSEIDTRQFVSLEDVVPTLLGLAGVPLTDHVSGVDLFLPDSFPTQRGIVARAAHAPRILAYRTPSWTLIDGPNPLELYDTRTDPFQRNNISFEHFERTACLRSLLELELSRPHSTPHPNRAILTRKEYRHITGPRVCSVAAVRRNFRRLSKCLCSGSDFVGSIVL